MLHQKWTVEQIECLERCRRDIPPRSDLPGIGTIERTKGAVQLHPRLGLIDHAAEGVRAEFGLRVVHFDIICVRVEEIKSGAADAEIELAAGRKNGVAQHFGFQASGWEAPQQPGLGIDPETVGLGMGGLSIRGGENDQLRVGELHGASFGAA